MRKNVKYFILTLILCAAIVQAQNFTVGEVRGEVSVNGKIAAKTGSTLNGKKILNIKTEKKSRFSIMSADGDITVTIAPESSVKISGSSIKIQQGSLLVSCYSDTVPVTIHTVSGKQHTVKDAEVLFSCRGKKECAAVLDGTVTGISPNAAVAKEIQKEFELKQTQKQEKKRNAPLFDQDSARPGA